MNKLTPGSNLLWRSSRFLLPEHVAEIEKWEEERLRKPKPELDEQQIEETMRGIAESLECKTEITLTIFGEYEDRQVKGYVVRIVQDEILFQMEDDDEWIPISDIIDTDKV